MACSVATWTMLSWVAVSPGMGTFEEELRTPFSKSDRTDSKCGRTSYSSFAMLFLCLPPRQQRKGRRLD